MIPDITPSTVFDSALMVRFFGNVVTGIKPQVRSVMTENFPTNYTDDVVINPETLKISKDHWPNFVAIMNDVNGKHHVLHIEYRQNSYSVLSCILYLLDKNWRTYPPKNIIPTRIGFFNLTDVPEYTPFNVYNPVNLLRMNTTRRELLDIYMDAHLERVLNQRREEIKSIEDLEKITEMHKMWI